MLAFLFLLDICSPLVFIVLLSIQHKLGRTGAVAAWLAVSAVYFITAMCCIFSIFP